MDITPIAPIQSVDLPGSVWPGLWDYTRKGFLLEGAWSIAPGPILLRSESRDRPEWKTMVKRVVITTLRSITHADALRLGYGSPDDLRQHVWRGRVLGLDDIITLVEIA